ncbi:NAD(P)/FAD-dependent oxidoreductase [Streptomyces monashensis]|uniref:FAD-dependent oxidoreductase n=1 Tax=Streptomyces monashensis TaxID=1678012 RepID=A0A1S2QIM5_9ACTN|nr:NAD(P)-binding protein [Streptomyces monashensis]OIK06019.1 hypothetical protein BIV23_10025 [Streptomyces monashensis]
MPTAVIVGGGIAGLAGALALSGIGYRVLVLERAPRPPRGSVTQAAPRWQDRPTVPQAGHSHTLTSLGVRVLRERAPQVLAAARAAGAHLLDLTSALPATVPDRAPEPGDSDLVALGCRRSTLELLLHRTVSDTAGVGVRHGVHVTAVELDRTARRVRAVVTDGGERLPADIVVDATGRRALSRTWLRAAGIPLAPDRTSPSGLTGYSRSYTLDVTTRPGPLNRGNAAGDIFGHYAGVLHPGDGGTFSVALAALPGDRALHGLRTPQGFTAAAHATPGLSPWLDDGISTPLGGVRVIACPPNTLRGSAGPLQQPVAGLFPVGDAACVTNPLFGRGMSLALEHAFRIADLLAHRPDVDIAQRRAVARLTHDLFVPWYEQSAASDRLRIARWKAAVAGTPVPTPVRAEGDPLPAFEEVAAAARGDATVWRGLTRVLMTLNTPHEVFGDEEFAERVRRAAPGAAPRPDGVGRQDLVRRVAAAEGALV